jgi:hypothetical protein
MIDDHEKKQVIFDIFQKIEKRRAVIDEPFYDTKGSGDQRYNDINADGFVQRSETQQPHLLVNGYLSEPPEENKDQEDILGP